MAFGNIGRRIRSLFNRASLDKEFFDDLEDLLIEGDLGVTTTLEIIEEIRGALTRGRKTDQELIALTKEILLRYLRTVRIERQTGIPLLVLVLGVNGVGKTTTIAKLADYFRRVQGMKEIFLAAADTFRAAAIDQLAIHGERLGLKVISQRPGADPGAVIYDTIESACAKKADMILADTAGRMHTKANLVKELQKIDKIIRARIPSYHSLLVIDSTTGQNGLRQAETFNEAIHIDSIVLSKLDSAAKGGIAVTIQRSLGIPFSFIGTGEKLGDIAPFDPAAFVDNLLAP